MTGGLLALTALAWVALLIDVERLMLTLRTATLGWLLIMLLAIAAEQLARACKWRQILHPVKPISTLRLFGAIMAGYLANILVPLGMSPLVRAWLVAPGAVEHERRPGDRGHGPADRRVVFAGFVALVLGFAVFPDRGGNIRAGLMVGGVGRLTLFAFLLGALAYHRSQMQQAAGRDALAGRASAGGACGAGAWPPRLVR